MLVRVLHVTLFLFREKYSSKFIWILKRLWNKERILYFQKFVLSICLSTIDIYYKRSKMGRMTAKKNLLKVIFIFIGLFGSMVLKAQDPPYWSNIQAFKKQDSIAPPPQHAIVFVGSSSFTKWQDVQTYFPNHPIINRGFGGSTLKDVIRYADDIIMPYHPKQVVIYCGDNDLAQSDTVTAVMVFDRFKQLHGQIRTGLGRDVDIVYVSIKPSASRQHLMPKMLETNRLIKKFLRKDRNAGFVDVYHPMLDAQGNPKADIFLKDSLHMNEKGYDIWQKEIKPFLID